ncbi:MAG: hypothetical protein ABJF50_11280 [Paracoccaceae bacterium]
MSLRKILSATKTDTSAKAASKPIKVASICIMVLTVGLIMKSAYEMKSAVRDIQRTVAVSADIPAQAEGAFYFIEPRPTATL